MKPDEITALVRREIANYDRLRLRRDELFYVRYSDPEHVSENPKEIIEGVERVLEAEFGDDYYKL